MIKQKTFIGSKLTFIFQVLLQLSLIKSINRKKAASQQPSLRIFVYHCKILLLLQLQL